MKNTQLGLVALLLVAVLGCGKLGELVKKSGNDAVPDEVKKNIEQALKTDFLADPPSPGASVVRQLTRLDPKAAEFQKTIEDLERSAIKEFAEKLSKEYKIDRSKLPLAQQKTQATIQRPPTLALISPNAPVVYGMLQGGQSSAPIGVDKNDITLTLLVVSYFNDLLAANVKDVGSISKTMRKENGNSYTDMTVEIGHGADGSNKFGFKMNTRGNAGNRSLDTDMEGSVDGQRCPQLDGSVYFTAKLKLTGKHGDNSYIQEVTAKITAQTNDDADVASSETRLNQGIQESAGGMNTYIETEYQINMNNGAYTASNPRGVRGGQNQGPRAEELATAGNESAMHAGMAALAFAEAMWQNGGCVKIEAPSPGNVEPSSVTEIPVSVKHKFDGSSVPSKVKVDLSGETSVSPKQIDQTPGKLSYTAPPEKNKSATIKLEARSKRGRAKLDLNATTGGNAYKISGNIDEASMSGTTCDSSQPFSIGGTLQFRFTPTSATTGTYTYSGPYSAKGSGPYVINGDGSMKLDGTGCIMGGNCKTYSHSWTATPIDPAECK
ncbi:MAG: hypothetical protein WBD16_08880 [Pyrinomonadaceae bacterium]